MSLVGLSDNLKLARDRALLGDYEASTICYSGVLNQLDLFLSSPPDQDQLARFKAASGAIKSEKDLVDCLKEELAKFSPSSPATPRKQISAPSFDTDYDPPSDHLLNRDPPAPFRPIPDRIRNRVSKEPNPIRREPRRDIHREPHKDPIKDVQEGTATSLHATEKESFQSFS
ncbi:hypothetical protein GEMRC1_008316 [Eukaryota sp. GEM-RC1]